MRTSYPLGSNPVRLLLLFCFVVIGSVAALPAHAAATCVLSASISGINSGGSTTGWTAAVTNIGTGVCDSTAENGGTLATITIGTFGGGQGLQPNPLNIVETGPSTIPCTNQGTYILCTVSQRADLAPGASYTVTFQALTAQTPAACRYTLQVDTTGWLNLSDETQAVAPASGVGQAINPSPACSAGQAANYTIVKTLIANSDPSGFAVPGGTLKYNVEIHNPSDSAFVTGPVVVYDAIPAGTTYVTSALGTQSGSARATLAFNAAADRVEMTFPGANAIDPGGDYNFTVTVQVDSPIPVSVKAISNVAFDSSAGPPPCPSVSKQCVTTNETPTAPAISVAKSVSVASFVLGQPATYTVTVTNTGTAATSAAVAVTDTIPSTLSVGAIPASCTAAGQVVTCTIPPGLATSASASFAIAVTPISGAGTSVSNTANGTGGGDPNCVQNCASNTVTTPITAAHLTISKAASGASFVLGQPGSYTLTVSNTGTAATTAVATINDAIPNALTIGAPPSGCTIIGQNVSCIMPTGLAVGASASFVIPVTPTSGVGTPAVNSASVSGGGDPACSSGCGSNTVTTPITAPQLALSKAASASAFVLNQPATYTLTVTNTGTAATTAIATINDAIPNALTIGAPPSGCTIIGQNVSCTVSTGLAVGASASFVIPVTPTAGGVSSVSNTATVGGGGDPNCTRGCDSNTVTTPVNEPHLVLTKSASAATFIVGQPASYSLTVTNNGSAATSAAATVVDVVPSGMTLGAASPGCVINGQSVTCTVASGLAVSATATFVIAVTPTAAAGTSVSNSATVSGGGDPNCSITCGSNTVTTPVTAPHLVIAKSASAASFVVGVPASYTLTVTNTGTAATTTEAVVSDTVPSALSVDSVPSGCTAAGQVVTCVIAAALPTNSPVTLVIGVTPTAAGNGTSVSNVATINGGGDPNCTVDCSSETVVTPINAPALVVQKTASSTSFVVGMPATYTLSATNAGTVATTAIATISDTVPATLTLGTLPSGCTASGQVVSCLVPNGLAVNGGVTYVLPVTPLAAADNTAVVNTATIVGGGDPSCPGAARCTSTVTTSVGAPALSVLKTASAATFEVGANVSYTITVTNTGSAATTAIATAADNVPSTLTLGVLPAGCIAAGQVVSCAIPAGLAAGSSVSFELPVTATTAAFGTTLANTANVSGGGDPACPGAARCTSTVTVPVSAPVLGIRKDAPATVLVNAPLVYVITLTNTATVASANSVVVLDALPANVTFVSAAPGTGVAGVTCTSAGASALLNCAVALSAPLVADGSATFVLNTTAPATPGVVTNYAATNPFGDGSAPGNPPTRTGCMTGATTVCADSSTNPGQPGTTTAIDPPIPAALSLRKAAAATVLVGADLPYTLTLTNSSARPSGTSLVVNDQLPANIGYVGVSAGAGVTAVNCVGAPALSCVLTLAAPLGEGQSASFTIDTTATAVGTAINYAATNPHGDGTPPGNVPTAQGCIVDANTACSDSTTTPGTPGTTTTVAPLPSLTLRKSAADTVQVGADMVYTLLVGNNSATASGTTIVVDDQLPVGVTYVSAAAGTGVNSVSCSGTSALVCSLTLAAPITQGSFATFTIATKAPVVVGTITNYASTNPRGDGTPPGNPPSTTGCVANATTVCSDTSTTPGNPGTTTTVIADPPPATFADMQAAAPASETVSIGASVTVLTTCSNAGADAATAPTCVVTGAPRNAVTVCSPLNLASMPVGMVITCSTSFAADTAGTIVLTTTAASATSDPNLGNNTASTRIVIQGAAVPPPVTVAPSIQPAPAMSDVGRGILIALLALGGCLSARHGVTASRRLHADGPL